MKKRVKNLMAVLLTIALANFVVSCASTGAPSKKTVAIGEQTGFLLGYYDKLKPGTGKDAPKLAWVKPGADFSKYKKVMVDYVIFAFAEDSDYKGIDANEMKKLGDSASLALVNALKKHFPVVSGPGPDVLRVRTAIIGLKPSHPGLSAVTSVVPVGLGISLAQKGATDAWTGSGATTAEMMVLDSTTNAVLGCGEDDRAAGFTERFSKWGSVQEAFDFWGERLANHLVTLAKKQ